MADPNNAAVIMVTATQNSLLGVVEGWSFEEVAESVDIQGEGTLGPSCVAIWRMGLTAVVDFLVKGVIAPGTKASLVFVSKDNLGNTITDTLANMRALGYAKDFQKKAPPARYRQLFKCENAFASDPVS